MKVSRILLSAFIIFSLVSGTSFIAGCNGGNGEEVEDGNNETAAQWAAYVFSNEVEAKSGGSGKIDTFSIEQTADGETVVIEGENLGTVDAEIETNRTALISPYDTDTITTTMECDKIRHTITTDTGESQATLYIPTDDFETSTLYFWIYPKAEYVDEDSASGMWSYYVTEEMSNDTDYVYLPYIEGEGYGFDAWAYGLYGWAWTWFAPYAEGGDSELEEFNYSIAGITYSCSQTTAEVGDYEFDAWTVVMTGPGYEYICTISPDLGLPIYLKIGSDGDYYEYELTDIELG
jgi:hypothetical protein